MSLPSRSLIVAVQNGLPHHVTLVAGGLHASGRECDMFGTQLFVGAANVSVFVSFTCPF